MQDIYLNDLSFSCSSRKVFIELFIESITGVLDALDRNLSARFVYRHKSIDEIDFGNNVYYNDVIEYLKNSDRDLCNAIIELNDKSCKIDDPSYVNEDISNIKHPSIKGLGLSNENDLDIILFAAISHSILMSLNTSEIWDKPNITIHYYEDDECSIYKSIDVGNISKKDHGKIWRDIFNPETLAKLSIEFGIYNIKIFAREHGIPHFHLLKKGKKLASIAIESFDIIAGEIPGDRLAHEAITLAKNNQSILRQIWKSNAQPGFIFYNS